jgi:HEAT repeat protein
VAGGKEAFDRKLEALSALRASPDAPETLAQLRRALKDRSNFVVSKAAAMVAELRLVDLLPDLLAAFDWSLADGAKTDPKCWAKNAIARALRDMEYEDADVFLRGSRHIQMEPAFGPPVDAATTLRGICALALAACHIDREIILRRLADLACDPEKEVRIDALRAFARLPAFDSEIALRMKALRGDAEPEVAGVCFDALLAVAPAHSVAFVGQFLHSDDEDVAIEAAAALAQCGEPKALELVTTFFEQGATSRQRSAILHALAASRVPAAAEFLLSVIAARPGSEAAVAITALAQSRFRDEFRERAGDAVRARDTATLSAAFQKEFGAADPGPGLS